jgi:protein kinase-like protein
MNGGILEKGTTLGGYKITGILGQGGMGVVYEAEQMTLNRTVALKVLAPHLSDDVLFRERFRREGQLQANIDHPHIVTVYEAGDSDEGVFIAMRLIRGPNLKDMIVSRELDPGRTIRILTPIAEALDTAHEAGLIHRDIKPQNILVAGRDHAFLADFGLTKGAGEKSLTKTGQFVGTFDYISPEQVKGEKATHKSDVYALAAVLYECLTGIVPFPKDSEAAVLYAQMADPPPKVTDQRPELPVSLDDVIALGMAKDPAERYNSCGQLLMETKRTFTQRTRAAFTPPRPLEAPQETGIRPAEADVPTRAGRAEDGQPATVPGGPDPTVPGGPEPTVAGEPDPTVPGGPGPTVPGGPGPTVPGGPGPTVPAEDARTAPAATAPTEPVPAAAAATAASGTAVGSTHPATASTRTLPAERRRVGMGPILLGLALLVLVLVGGFLIGKGGGGSDGSAAAADNVNTAGALELSYPDGWQRAQSPPEIPGLRLQQPIALSQSGEGGGGSGSALQAGTTGATGASLLPAAFLKRLDDEPPRDDAVRLGDLDSYRYRDLRPRGFDGRLTVYVAPTTAGVVTVACSSTAAAAETFLPDCENVAGGLKLVDGEAFALGPDKDYLAKLDKATAQLNKDRKSGSAALRKAKGQDGQAKAAASLAKAYGRARSSLRGDPVSPAVRGAAASVQSALTQTQAAYTRLSAAAKRGNSGAYGSARQAVKKGEAALQDALRGVRAASS